MPRPQSHWDDVRSYLVQKGEANAGVVALFVPERLTANGSRVLNALVAGQWQFLTARVKQILQNI
jgi:hypothetical protein